MCALFGASPLLAGHGGVSNKDEILLKSSRLASLGSVTNESVGESFEVDSTDQLAR